MNNSKTKLELLDYLIKAIKYRNVIILNFLFFLLITYAITLFLPKWYKAEVVLLPPEKDISLGLSALMSNLPIAPAAVGMASQESNKYIALLESKNLRHQIIREKKLVTIYNVNHLEEAYEELSKNTTILLGNEGQIQVQVFDKTAEQSAEIANLYAFYLDSLYTRFTTQKAHFNRLFFEKQLQETRDSLNQAESSMKEFQSTYGAIALPEQIEATIKASSELIAQKFALQIELNLKEKSLESTHTDIIILKQTIKAIDEKLNSIEQSEYASESVFLSFKNLPGLGLNYARLLRNVEIQNKLFAIIYQQYQQSKIEEAKDTPSVQILDKASPPYKRAKPKRVLTAMVSAISTTLILLIGLLIRIHINFIKETDQIHYQKITTLLTNLFYIKQSKKQV
jgi:tyrosine-protein kinase Etk/Wzc